MFTSLFSPCKRLALLKMYQGILETKTRGNCVSRALAKQEDILSCFLPACQGPAVAALAPGPSSLHHGFDCFYRELSFETTAKEEARVQRPKAKRTKKANRKRHGVNLPQHAARAAAGAAAGLFFCLLGPPQEKSGKSTKATSEEWLRLHGSLRLILLFVVCCLFLYYYERQSVLGKLLLIPTAGRTAAWKNSGFSMRAKAARGALARLSGLFSFASFSFIVRLCTQTEKQRLTSEKTETFKTFCRALDNNNNNKNNDSWCK